MNDELYHYGVIGMKWGVRRYQNADGTLTSAGKKKYSAYKDKQIAKSERKIQKFENDYLLNTTKKNFYSNLKSLGSNHPETQRQGFLYADRSAIVNSRKAMEQLKLDTLKRTKVDDIPSYFVKRGGAFYKDYRERAYDFYVSASRDARTEVLEARLNRFIEELND